MDHESQKPALETRPYRDGDAEELWRLFHTTIRTVNLGDYTEAQVAVWAPDEIDDERWRARVEGMAPIIAVEADGSIAGYASLLDDGCVDHFFVRHDRQRRGVGAMLMHAILESAAHRDIARLYSEVSITARPFFEHFGFVVREEQHVQVGNESLMNFRMELAAPPPSPR